MADAEKRADRANQTSSAKRQQRRTTKVEDTMKPGIYRYFVASLLFIAGVINYMDRAALGIAAPLVSKDLELSPSALGVVFSTFFVGYSIFAFVGGHLADKYGPRRVYSWAALLWSVT